MYVLGFCAAGRAGKASELVGARCAGAAGRETVGTVVIVGVWREGRVEGPEEEEVHGTVWFAAPPWLPAPVRGPGIAGNASCTVAAFEPPQLPCLLTFDLELCAVELFSRNTRIPPLPASAAEDAGKTPPGPGSEG